MLVSPIRVHGLLTGLLNQEETSGPHTALLITPQGLLLAHATLPDHDDESKGDGGADDGENGHAGDEGAEGSDGGNTSVSDEGDDEDDDEPWLEGPERLRLLLGLASQWEEDESPRVECELGRLFLRPIALPEPEVPPAGAAVPNIKAPEVHSFVLVLNGTSATPWSKLSAKADNFLAQW